MTPVLFFNPDWSTPKLYIHLSTAMAPMYEIFFNPDRSTLGLYIPLSTAMTPVLFLNPETYPGAVHSCKYCYGTCFFLSADRSILGLYISLSTAMSPVLFCNPYWSNLGVYISLSTAMSPVLFCNPSWPNLRVYISLSTAKALVLFSIPDRSNHSEVHFSQYSHDTGLFSSVTIILVLCIPLSTVMGAVFLRFGGIMPLFVYFNSVNTYRTFIPSNSYNTSIRCQ